MFHASSPEDIKSGKVTDVYFARTLEILKAKGIDRQVRAEFFAKKLPNDIGWGVFAGVEEFLKLMEGRKVSIRGLSEGQVFRAWEPVLEVRGSYQEFCVFETALLGLICQSSGIATKAARIRLAAGEKTVMSFGARRMHPAIAPMIERAAFIGGCDGVSVIESAELIEADPMGTMPHALILMLGDTIEAIKAFDDVIDKKVKRVALIDTFNDEKFEALRVADAMKGKLHAVRLDTPSSRKGDFYRIFEEVRWELDLRGYKHVKLFASGGLDEEEVLRLSPVADGFGVGTCISNAPVIDFSMDIVEIEGKPVAKRGKSSGAKDLLKCTDCHDRKMVPLGAEPGKCHRCGGVFRSVFENLMEDGKLTKNFPKPREIRDKLISRLNEEKVCL